MWLQPPAQRVAACTRRVAGGTSTAESDGRLAKFASASHPSGLNVRVRRLSERMAAAGLQSAASALRCSRRGSRARSRRSTAASASRRARTVATSTRSSVSDCLLLAAQAWTAPRSEPSSAAPPAWPDGTRRVTAPRSPWSCSVRQSSPGGMGCSLGTLGCSLGAWAHGAAAWAHGAAAWAHGAAAWVHGVAA